MTANRDKLWATVFAILAAAFYALSVPLSKKLLLGMGPTMLAGFLYLGAGVGIGIMYLFRYKKEDRSERLTRKDLPYTIGMIVLDILAPIFLMFGIDLGTASNASLLGNFEIVATTLIALLLFKETVSPKLWTAIALITVASLLLSFEDSGSLSFSVGSLFVLLATVSWGFENNCTRKISGKSTYEIVFLKGIFSGSGALAVAFCVGERLPEISFILWALPLGFLSYGFSVFLYIRAQRSLGAAKTSAYYAVAPFLGVLLSLLIDNERPTWFYGVAFAVMLAGTGFVVWDTLKAGNLKEQEPDA